MKKNYYFIILALIVLITGYNFYPDDGMRENSQPQKTATERRPTSTEIKPDIPSGNSTQSSTTSTITKIEIKALKDSLPLKTNVAKEIQANPHSPSPSLMLFSKNLGPLMEKAINNKSDAFTLTEQLSACALDESAAASARALCVLDTKDLSVHHPELKEKASELRAGVSPDVQKILETDEAIFKKK